MREEMTLVLEAADAFDDGARFVWDARAGALVCSITQEKAVDSYNQTFECVFSATKEQAIALRDFLTALNLDGETA